MSHGLGFWNLSHGVDLLTEEGFLLVRFEKILTKGSYSSMICNISIWGAGPFLKNVISLN